MPLIVDQIGRFSASPFGQFRDLKPWELTAGSAQFIERLLGQLGDDYSVTAGIAIHASAIVEPTAAIKGPAIVGPGCFVGAGALLRGGCWLEADCILGPGSELKSSFVFAGSRLAHFNFVGDSLLGSHVNLEAGAVIANHRNEWPNRAISFVYKEGRIDTGVGKFGAVVGDRVKIGANAVIAPGAILTPGTIVGRLSLVDQAPVDIASGEAATKGRWMPGLRGVYP